MHDPLTMSIDLTDAPATALTDTRRPLLAFVRLEATAAGAALDEEWIGVCHRLTPRLERLGPSCVLLDLGTTHAAEIEGARALVVALLDALAGYGLFARAGIGPSSALAQLALLMAPVHERVALVAPQAAPAFVRAVPVSLLAHVQPQGALSLEVFERFHRFGLRTLGHLARLSEPTVRRQFGESAGKHLALLCRGEDPRPLHPTPPTHWHRARLRGMPALPATQLIRLLPHLVGRAAARLDGHDVGAVRLGIRWESGNSQMASSTLRARTSAVPTLTHAAERLLDALLQAAPPDEHTDEHGAHVEALHLWLGACAPHTPSQATFWRTAQQRHAAVQALAETLARRHGRPVVLCPRQITSAAIFAEDGYALLPTGTEHAYGRSGSGAEPVAPCGAHGAWADVPQRLHWW